MLPFRQSLDPETLFRVPSVYNYDVSLKGDAVAFSWDKSGQLEIYIQTPPGGYVKCLTKGGESKISPCFSPDGSQIAFTQDYKGDENFDIFLLELSDEEAWNLTPDTDEAIYPHVRWSPDARRIAFVSNRSKRFGVYTIPSSGGEPECVSDHEFNDSDPEWSSDGKWIAFSALIAAQDHGIFITPANGGEIRRLDDNDKPMEASSPEWSPDGKAIAFMSSELGSSDIGVWNLESGSVEWVTNSHYECYDPQWFPEGRKLAYLVNRNGNVSIAIHNLETHVTDVLEFREGVHAQIGLGRDPETMFFTFSSPSHPPDLWNVNLNNQEFNQLTNSLPSTIDPTLFVKGSSVSYLSKDGLEIPTLLYLPKTSNPAKPGPSLIYVHGGPTLQHMNEWHPSIQHLVSRGFVVVVPNYRGSSGFGRKFREANRFVLGNKDLDDVVAAAGYLIEKQLTDPRRIGILGESYGGYLTLCALTKFPKYWAAGAAMVPFLNWFTEIENEREDLQYWDRENMGDPKEDYDRFRNSSPIFFIDAIEAPVHLISGANDPRCPASETKHAQDMLQKSGKVFDLVVYQDEGHEFRRLDNRVDAHKRIAKFLGEYLQP